MDLFLQARPPFVALEHLRKSAGYAPLIEALAVGANSRRWELLHANLRP